MLEKEKDIDYWNKIKNKQHLKEQELIKLYTREHDDYIKWETDFIKEKLNFYNDDDSTQGYKDFVNVIQNLNRIHHKTRELISDFIYTKKFNKSLSSIVDRYLNKSEFFKKGEK